MLYTHYSTHLLDLLNLELIWAEKIELHVPYYPISKICSDVISAPISMVKRMSSLHLDSAASCLTFVPFYNCSLLYGDIISYFYFWLRSIEYPIAGKSIANFWSCLPLFNVFTIPYRLSDIVKLESWGRQRVWALIVYYDHPYTIVWSAFLSSSSYVCTAVLWWYLTQYTYVWNYPALLNDWSLTNWMHCYFVAEWCRLPREEMKVHDHNF